MIFFERGVYPCPKHLLNTWTDTAEPFSTWFPFSIYNFGFRWRDGWIFSLKEKIRFTDFWEACLEMVTDVPIFKRVSSWWLVGNIVTFKKYAFINDFCNSVWFIWLILAIVQVCNINYWSAIFIKQSNFENHSGYVHESARSEIYFDSIWHNVVPINHQIFW